MFASFKPWTLLLGERFRAGYGAFPYLKGAIASDVTRQTTLHSQHALHGPLKGQWRAGTFAVQRQGLSRPKNWKLWQLWWKVHDAHVDLCHFFVWLKKIENIYEWNWMNIWAASRWPNWLSEETGVSTENEMVCHEKDYDAFCLTCLKACH